MKAGSSAMVGAATDTASRTVSQEDVEAGLRRAQYTDAQISEFREKVRNALADAMARADDPATRQRAAETATQVTWWAFAGALVFMLAAVAGGCVGAGPTFRLFGVAVSRTHGV